MRYCNQSFQKRRSKKRTEIVAFYFVVADQNILITLPFFLIFAYFYEISG
jgi:predicted CDP-diglyceride synthetase/phosphatidate cytidylyltransferase